MDYRGKFVFVQAKDRGTNDGSYNDGEYLCIQSSPNCLYCVKPGGVYNMHNQHSFNLIGERSYEVIENYSDDALARDMVTEALAECDEVDAGKKPEWVGSVYTNARANAKRILRLLGDDTPPTPIKKSVPVSVDFEVIIKINGQPMVLVPKK